MKCIIAKKEYDTEKAEIIAYYYSGIKFNDPNTFSEELYVTKKGNYFLYGSGGPMTKYKEFNGKKICGGDKIIPLSNVEAYVWLEEHNETDAIEEYFTNEFEDA